MSFAFTLCADDYALSPAVSHGILEAIDAGRLSATGAMTNMPDWPAASAALRARSGEAWYGLHLNLTLGTPLGSMSGFAPDGRLPTIGAIAKNAALAQSALQREVTDEIRRQIDAFAQAMGRIPDFIDGHQHVHGLRTVRGALFDALEQTGIGNRAFLRNSGDRLSRILRRGGEVVKAATVAALSAGFAREALRRGYETNDGFAGFSRFDPTDDYKTSFRRYLRAPGPSHLIMCHPGRVDDALRAADPVTDTREQELDFLLSGAFPQLLVEAGARLAKPA